MKHKATPIPRIRRSAIGGSYAVQSRDSKPDGNGPYTHNLTSGIMSQDEPRQRRQSYRMRARSLRMMAEQLSDSRTALLGLAADYEDMAEGIIALDMRNEILRGRK